MKTIDEVLDYINKTIDALEQQYKLCTDADNQHEILNERMWELNYMRRFIRTGEVYWK